jgi:hypothetical protein
LLPLRSAVIIAPGEAGARRAKRPLPLESRERSASRQAGLSFSKGAASPFRLPRLSHLERRRQPRLCQPDVPPRHRALSPTAGVYRPSRRRIAALAIERSSAFPACAGIPRLGDLPRLGGGRLVCKSLIRGRDDPSGNTYIRAGGRRGRVRMRTGGGLRSGPQAPRAQAARPLHISPASSDDEHGATGAAILGGPRSQTILFRLRLGRDDERPASPQRRASHFEASRSVSRSLRVSRIR